MLETARQAPKPLKGAEMRGLQGKYEATLLRATLTQSGENFYFVKQLAHVYVIFSSLIPDYWIVATWEGWKPWRGVWKGTL